MECVLAVVGKIILITLNIVFMVIALGIIIAGIILKFFPGTLLKFIFDGVQGVTQFETPSAFGDMKDVPMLAEIGLVLLLVGLVLFCVSFTACCGACCEYRILLIVYIIVMIALTLVITVVGALLLERSSPLHNNIKEELKKQVNTGYKGPTATDTFSLSVNILSYSLECCGMTGPEDFNTPSNEAWKNYTYNSVTYQIDVTPACCNKAVLETDTAFTCAMKTAAGVYNTTRTNTQGCYDKLLDMLQDVKAWGIVGLIILIILLILLVIFAIIIVKQASKIGPI